MQSELGKVNHAMNTETDTKQPVSTVGIIGYGRFGRVLADGLRNDFSLRIHDPFAAFDNTPDTPSSLADTASSDAVFICVPIVHFEEVVRQTAPYLRAGSMLLDVCSVKLFPERVMKRYVADDVVILPTHPMFGPDTARAGGQELGWKDLPFVLCPLSEVSESLEQNHAQNHATNTASEAAVAFWRDYLTTQRGCRVVSMPSEEHDRITAYTLCLTQLLGRVLGNIGIKASDIDAQSFTHLLRMKEISYNDSMELLIGLHRYNPFAAEMRRRLREEFQAVEPFLQPIIEQALAQEQSNGG
jgi:prephenate dehydrogenase